MPPGAFALLAPGLADAPNMVIHSAEDWDTACMTFPDPTSDEGVSMDCLLEIQELDLYAGGLQFDMVVSGGICGHVAWNHYQYQAWPIGQGPTEVLIEVDPLGNIVGGAHHVAGVPSCEYDHSADASGAPNCCLGTYVVVTYPEGTDPLEEGTVSEPRSWGGEASACHGGAAYIDPGATFTGAGWPLTGYASAGLMTTARAFAFPALAELGFMTNVPLANYFEPDNHGGGPPAGLTGDFAQPYYVFACLDGAGRQLARLRLQVREWNEASEFVLGADGDPSTTGTDANGHPVDAWADWEVATPGNDTWIMDND